MIDRSACDLLRRHVGHGAHHDPLAGVEIGLHFGIQGILRRRCSDLGEPEIQHLDPPVTRHHDIGRLEIAVDDAFGVSSRQRLGNGSANLEDPVDVHPTLVDEAIEGLPFDQLHGQEMHAVELLHRVHADHSGVVEGRQHGGLPAEAIQPLRVGGHLRRQNLQCNVAP